MEDLFSDHRTIDSHVSEREQRLLAITLEQPLDLFNLNFPILLLILVFTLKSLKNH